jgi:hypothetical protein
MALSFPEAVSLQPGCHLNPCYRQPASARPYPPAHLRPATGALPGRRSQPVPRRHQCHPAHPWQCMCRPSKEGWLHPGGYRAPWPLPAPPPPVQNGQPAAASPRHHSRRCLASRREPLPLGPRPDAGAPGTRPPLPAPGGESGDGTPTPPGQDALSGNFFKKSFPGEYTPGDGTEPKNFKTIFDRGITQMDRLIDTP